MRVNVYTEELPILEHHVPNRFAEIVVAEYISSRTGQSMKNYGLRIYMLSAPQLHDSEKDDDRSAITFWCGSSVNNVYQLIRNLNYCVEQSNMVAWREKVGKAAQAAEAKIENAADTGE